MSGSGKYRLGVLYGDGIGPEIVAAAWRALRAAERAGGVELFDPVELPMGLGAIREHGSALPQRTKDELGNCHGWLMGPHDSASYPAEHRAATNPSGELRKRFDLYANIRPSRTLQGVRGVAKDADLVIFRENTEEFYPDRNLVAGSGEWQVTPDVVVTAGVFTRRAAERIAHAAFRAAERRRGLVSIVHKANVIKLGSGLFLRTCLEVAEQYPHVRVNDYHVDAAAARLVRSAGEFDVIVTTNLFGDILSDLAGELTGSLGLSPSINAGDDIAMAQAAHGSAPDIAGQDKANPVGMLLSAAMLADWLGAKHGDSRLTGIGRRLDGAVAAALAAGVATADLGGAATTGQFAQAVIARLEAAHGG
ncbi:isocitrate/isopropylmalate dehydrogenase family protein [Cohnella fermenti]|uniref:Isocitrate/isopropylmalate dehydrogenase family protein n=1 Tax=Cohnella fermenti TaxID=2565925 RepID=A0A4S4C680_9BACL|nr:isocitrate/isopropylmalate family dehydrogenase [Cohnella fermenti]THF83295.1 isocitrate/isopropylmalate dehydrogenase family protein [Cohnella fermenti]